MRQRLTHSPTFHFLCCNRKDRQYLHHNLDDYVPHSRGRYDASVYLKSMEETFNAIENLDELVTARGSIFRRLRDMGVKIG